MTIARACHPPTQVLCERLAGRWWIAQHPPRFRAVKAGHRAGCWTNRIGTNRSRCRQQLAPIRMRGFVLGERGAGGELLSRDHSPFDGRVSAP